MTKKLMLRLPVPAPSAPVLMGSSTLLALAAGIVAVVGVSTLHKRAQLLSAGPSGSSENVQVRVGLLRVHVPQNFR